MRYILNSAVITGPGLFRYFLLSREEAKQWLDAEEHISCMGYEETILAFEAVFSLRPGLNRQTVKLVPGDEALVFRLTSRIADPRQKGGIGLQTILDNLEIGLLVRLADEAPQDGGSWEEYQHMKQTWDRRPR